MLAQGAGTSLYNEKQALSIVFVMKTVIDCLKAFAIMDLKNKMQEAF